MYEVTFYLLSGNSHAYNFNTEIVSLKMRTISLFLFPLALAPPLLFYLLPGKRSALLTDILALCFAHNAMAIIKIDSFQTGSILLSGLFLYDIWWVFGTNVVS